MEIELMAQNVDMIIEVRLHGGPNKKHLHLKAALGKIHLDPPADGQVNWMVHVDSGTISNPNQIGLTAVTLWFPHPDPIFIQSEAIPIPVREVTIPLSNGTGSALLTINRSFNRSGRDPFVVPIAIYCTVDGGQDTLPANPNHDFDQRGRQMIDGHHSHPECNVGP